MSSPANPHLHRAFGLNIRSCLPLPELLPGAAGAVPDVTIEYGDVPRDLPDALVRGVRFQAGKERLLLVVDGVARYLIENGHRIVIADDRRGADEDVRAFILGPVLGAVLHQRNDLVLHGSAIEWNCHAVVFLGVSGAGKSTLAAAFRKRGRPILTDDLSVIRPDKTNHMLTYPGYPQMKLWVDSLEQLELSPEQFRKIRSKIEKRAVPIEGQFVSIARPTKKIYLLWPYNQSTLKLSSVSGPQKLNILKNHTYRFGFVAAIAQKAEHFQHALSLAQQVPLAIASRPSGAFELEKLVSLVEEDLTKLDT